MNWFQFYIPLFQIMVMNTWQKKIKIEPVLKICTKTKFTPQHIYIVSKYSMSDLWNWKITLWNWLTHSYRARSIFPPAVLNLTERMHKNYCQTDLSGQIVMTNGICSCIKSLSNHISFKPRTVLYLVISTTNCQLNWICSIMEVSML